ncbi:phosphatidic acid phosphatase type 2/haloperoxidase [Russula dissimulans]|nr:phosphatidic acid phosphatase type 2/haloperoxidase [Russula dissimulans]
MPFRTMAGPGNRSSSQILDRKKLLFSYAPDWILTITLALAFFLLDKIDGFKREFSVSDTSLSHTFAVHERVPDLLLYVIAFLAPLVLQWLINLATIRTWWDAHNSALGLVLSLSLAGAFTQAIKVTVGRPRPDLLSRCNPDQGVVDPTFGLSTAAICHQSDRQILNDGFRSFPSGHSSLSFAGLTFLSLYIAGKLHLFDTRGHAPKAWISVLPLFGAALVAISRTMDYRHHWHDVLAGSFLGIVTAYFSYRQYFPSLASDLAHLPYAPRTQYLEHTHSRPAPGLPYYRSLVESERVERTWEQGPSLEEGPHL